MCYTVRFPISYAFLLGLVEGLYLSPISRMYAYWLLYYRIFCRKPMLWYLFVLCYCFVLYLLVNDYPFAVIILYYSSDINNSILPKSRPFIYCNRIVLYHTGRCFSSQRQAALLRNGCIPMVYSIRHWYFIPQRHKFLILYKNNKRYIVGGGCILFIWRIVCHLSYIYKKRQLI